MTKVVLIDDEPHALEMLEWQLQTYCPQLQICALCRSADEGINAIRNHQPQLVFLDIEMPKKNGFEVLLAFPDPFFDVVFTTAYNQFAIKAIRFAALDFLLKPVDADDLVAAVQRFEKKDQQRSFAAQLQQLMQQYRQPDVLPGKIPFTASAGIVFVKPEDIVYCEAVSNYTHIFFTDRPKLTISKTLRDVEDLLLPYHFFRVHHSFLMNLQHVSKYVKADGGSVEMSNGALLPVSRQKKEALMEVLLKR